MHYIQPIMTETRSRNSWRRSRTSGGYDRITSTPNNLCARVFVCVLRVLLIGVLQLELDETGKDMTGMRA